MIKTPTQTKMSSNERQTVPKSVSKDSNDILYFLYFDKQSQTLDSTPSLFSKSGTPASGGSWMIMGVDMR